MYAQTNVQLYHQLLQDKCSPDDLTLVRRAYELAIGLFSGLYRPSGKTFVNHVVGTSSIVHVVRRKPSLTAAGLLHAAYACGDFGFIGRISPRVRTQRMLACVGSEVESYVRMYSELPWKMGDADALACRIDSMTQIERDVVLLRCANELEDHLDRGTLYCYSAAEHKSRLQQKRDSLSGLASRLGSAVLEREIDRVFGECADQPVVPELLPRVRRPRSHRILPESCRRSTWLYAYDTVRRVFR